MGDVYQFPGDVTHPPSGPPSGRQVVVEVHSNPFYVGGISYNVIERFPIQDTQYKDLVAGLRNLGGFWSTGTCAGADVFVPWPPAAIRVCHLVGPEDHGAAQDEQR